MATSIQLRVDPNVLRQKAEEFQTLIQSIQRTFEQVQQTASHTLGYWRGEAGDRCREGYRSYEDDIQYILGRLKEHPKDLLQMAGLYEQTESHVVRIGEQLKVDQIV